MCDVLNIPRRTYYYESKIKENQPNEFTNEVINAFKDNRKAYGTRRINKYLAQGINLSRRRIGRIMRINGQVSRYTVAKYKIHKDTCKEAKVANIVGRNFDNKEHLDVVVSDLTYVSVNGKWIYMSNA